MPQDPQDAQETQARRGGGAAVGPARVVGGRYRLEGVLGRGGMGVVWAGHDEVLHRPVAVKELSPPPSVDDAARAEVRARTLREAQAAARISAEGVVGIHDVVEDDGRPWIVMERLPPRTLEDELTERGGLPPEEVAQIGASLLAGLAAAHAAGVLHRDVKPSNVMFRERSDGRQAVLADFGIAHLDGDAMLTATGMMMGSPAFIAPERARGESATPASDLWSLGVTLWAAVEGWSPFRRTNSLASLNAVLTEDVPPATRAGPLAPVLDGLLRKDPAERIDAATARRLLADAAPSSGTPAVRPGAGSTQPLPAAVTSPEPPVAVVEPGPGAVLADSSPEPVGAPVTTQERPPSWPPAGPAPDEHPAPGRRRRLVPAALALAVVALVAVGAAVLGVLDDDGAPGQAGPDTPATAPADEPEAPGGGEAEQAPEEDGSDAGEPEESPAPEDPGADGSGQEGSAPEEGQGSQGEGSQGQGSQVPEGFELHEDPTGFRVAVPAGWRAERDGPRVYLRDPASRAFLL
ncbi:MAG: protein kinase, partial [Dietzia sp.]|nr:protein kinase [Dietzia sp.]